MSSNISPTLSSNNIRIYEEEDLSVYEIQRGSRLRIDRGAFSHWEVFIGMFLQLFHDHSLLCVLAYTCI